MKGERGLSRKQLERNRDRRARSIMPARLERDGLSIVWSDGDRCVVVKDDIGTSYTARDIEAGLGGRLFATIEVADEHDLILPPERLSLSDHLTLSDLAERLARHATISEGIRSDGGLRAADAGNADGLEWYQALLDALVVEVWTHKQPRAAGHGQMQGEVVDFNAPDEPHQAVVADLLERGQIALLVDDEGQGKSFEAEASAAHVHRGRRLGGRRVERGAVVLCDGQLGARRLRSRLTRAYRGFAHEDVRRNGGDADERFRTLHKRGYPFVIDCRASPMNLLTDAGCQALREHGLEAQRRAGRPLSLLIIDTRDQFIGDADINDPLVAERFYATLRAFQAEFSPPPAVLVLVNARKRTAGQAGENWPSQRVAGSTRWKDLADTILALRVGRKGGRRTLDWLTIWAAKDRDDIVHPLTLKVEDVPSGGIIFRAQQAREIEIDMPAPGRPKKTAQAAATIRAVLEERRGRCERTLLARLCGERGVGEHSLRAGLRELEASGDVLIDKEKRPHVVTLSARAER